jgi:hypothetical protein
MVSGTLLLFASMMAHRKVPVLRSSRALVTVQVESSSRPSSAITAGRSRRLPLALVPRPRHRPDFTSMRPMICCPVIRTKSELIRAPGRRPSRGEGRAVGAARAGAQTGGVSADHGVGRRRAAVIEHTAADSGVVAAEAELDRRQPSTAMGPTAGAPYPPGSRDHTDRLKARRAPLLVRLTRCNERGDGAVGKCSIH